MPSRVVRGEFNESRSMSEVSVLAELAFVKLILACDDFGRMDGRASVLKARLFPARESITAGKLLAAVRELETNGCVRLYEIDGSPYLELVNWEKHRGRGRRATVSKYPDPIPSERTEAIRGNPRKSEDCHADPPGGYGGMVARDEGYGDEGRIVDTGVSVVWSHVVEAFGHYGRKPTELTSSRRKTLERVVRDHGRDGPAHAVHGYVWFHREPGDSYDPGKHFTPDTVFRASKVAKYVEAFAEAEAAGRSPPFPLWRAPPVSGGRRSTAMDALAELEAEALQKQRDPFDSAKVINP